MDVASHERGIGPRVVDPNQIVTPAVCGYVSAQFRPQTAVFSLVNSN